jgi:hypothetical protein
MSKNVIVQTNIVGDSELTKGGMYKMFAYVPQIYEVSHRRAKEYADRIGADYVQITDDRYYPGAHPIMQKCGVFHSDFDKWDNIVHFDSDLIVHHNTPNIFQVMDDSDRKFFCAKEDYKGFPRWKNYFNVGFFGIKRELLNAFKPIWKEYWDKHTASKTRLTEQGAMNEMIETFYPEYGILSSHWNGILATKSPLFTTHYCGPIIKARFGNFERVEKHKHQVLSNLSPQEIDDLIFYSEENDKNFNSHHTSRKRGRSFKGHSKNTESL